MANDPNYKPLTTGRVKSALPKKTVDPIKKNNLTQ